jgi:hypothetical protein
MKQQKEMIGVTSAKWWVRNSKLLFTHRKNQEKQPEPNYMTQLLGVLENSQRLTVYKLIIKNRPPSKW